MDAREVRAPRTDRIGHVGALGKGYAPAQKRSPLVGRLERMKRELSMGSDTFERKLRYLLWLDGARCHSPRGEPVAAAEVRPQRRRDHDRAVGLLKVLE